MGLFGGRRSAKDGVADDDDEVLFSGGSTVRLQQPGVVTNGDEETAKRCVRRDETCADGRSIACRAIGGSRSIARGSSDGHAGGVCELRIGVFWIGSRARVGPTLKPATPRRDAM